MPTLRDSRDRADLLRRIDALTPEHQGRWGTLTAARMMCHVADQLRVALGEMPSKDRTTLLSRTLVKRLVLSGWLPIPKGRVRTVPEMLSTPETAWHDDVATLHRLIDDLARVEDTAPHPLFGPLRPHEWGRLSALHLDHHLRQFGV
ncbi:MAG: DUF1569 domain-containing protein [Acidobacteriota bacterium]